MCLFEIYKQEMIPFDCGEDMDSFLLYEYGVSSNNMFVIGIHSVSSITSLLISNPNSTLILFEKFDCVLNDKMKHILCKHFRTRMITFILYDELRTSLLMINKRRFDLIVVHNDICGNENLLKRLVIRGNSLIINRHFEFIDDDFVLWEDTTKYAIGCLTKVENNPLELVICRYDNDLSWVKTINRINTLIHIHNKGIPLQLDIENTTIINVENIGDDQHSHLKYIVDHYDNLADIVVFLQDVIIEHWDIYGWKGILVTNENEMIFQMITEAKKYGFSQNFDDYKQFGARLLPSKELKSADGVLFADWFETYIRQDHDWDKKFYWYKNALFAVKKEFILSNPKEYYVKLLSLFVVQRSALNDFFERSWIYLLNLDSHLLRTISA